MRIAFKEFNEITGHIEHLYHEAAIKMNLSDSEMDILYILNSYNGECSQKTIYKESWLTKSTVNTALKKMERNKLILIKPSNGRNTVVSATDKGYELIKNTTEKIIKIENEIYDSWSSEEQKTFIELNRNFATQLSDKIDKL